MNNQHESGTEQLRKFAEGETHGLVQKEPDLNLGASSNLGEQKAAIAEGASPTKS
jgi:hypothetical protein